MPSKAILIEYEPLVELYTDPKIKIKKFGRKKPDLTLCNKSVKKWQIAFYALKLRKLAKIENKIQLKDFPVFTTFINDWNTGKGSLNIKHQLYINENSIQFEIDNNIKNDKLPNFILDHWDGRVYTFTFQDIRKVTITRIVDSVMENQIIHTVELTFNGNGKIKKKNQTYIMNNVKSTNSYFVPFLKEVCIRHKIKLTEKVTYKNSLGDEEQDEVLDAEQIQELENSQLDV
jgi:hypothetical protein